MIKKDGKQKSIKQTEVDPGVWLNWFMRQNYGALSEIFSGEYSLCHMNAPRNCVRN